VTDEIRSLSVQQGGALQVGGFAIDGIDGLDASDVTIPRYEIVQPAGRKSGAPGQLHHNLTDTAVDAVRAVILRISRTRVLWSGEPGTSKGGPECSSQDGLTGRTYGACNQCQFNREVNATLDQQLRDGKSVKVCDRGYTYLACDPDDVGAMFMISMYRSSATSGRILNSQFVMKRKSPYTAVVRFKTKMGTSDKGKYFVYDPVIESWFKSPAEYAAFQDASRAMQGVAIKEVETEESSVDAAAQEGTLPTNPHIERARAAAQPPTPPTELDAEQQAVWDGLGATKTPPAKPLPF
jgi:hypothetical protein